MKRNATHVVILLAALAGLAATQDRNQPSPRSEERITREVRHQLLMLPYFGVFDNISFKVEGDTVTLLGDVVRPSLKSDAENTVKHIEGVEK
jgi:hyperosmotically inducible periplasmic protein